jgi:hypothetical protein
VSSYLPINCHCIFVLPYNHDLIPLCVHPQICSSFGDSEDSIEDSSIMDEAIEEEWTTDTGLAKKDNILERGLVTSELDVTKVGMGKYDIMMDSEDDFLAYLDNGDLSSACTLQGQFISAI